MFERVLRAFRTRVRLQVQDLRTTPAFFDFIHRIVADFDGIKTLSLMAITCGIAWLGSSFGEMYPSMVGLAWMI